MNASAAVDAEAGDDGLVHPRNAASPPAIRIEVAHHDAVPGNGGSAAKERVLLGVGYVMKDIDE
jgi:hypothetical protein